MSWNRGSVLLCAIHCAVTVYHTEVTGINQLIMSPAVRTNKHAVYYFGDNKKNAQTLGLISL